MFTLTMPSHEKNHEGEAWIIFVRGERRSNAVTELVEVPSIDYAEPMPEIMSEANNFSIQRFNE